MRRRNPPSRIVRTNVAITYTSGEQVEVYRFGWPATLAISLTAIVALIAAYQAAKDTDPDLLALLVTLGASKNQIFYKVVMPSSLPGIIATFRINVGFGLVGAVVGEFISSQRGLGHMIFTASSFYDLDTVWLGLFTLMAIGFGLYFIIDLIERRMLRWKLAQHRTELHV